MVLETQVLVLVLVHETQVLVLVLVLETQVMVLETQVLVLVQLYWYFRLSCESKVDSQLVQLAQVLVLAQVAPSVRASSWQILRKKSSKIIYCMAGHA